MMTAVNRTGVLRLLGKAEVQTNEARVPFHVVLGAPLVMSLEQ